MAEPAEQLLPETQYVEIGFGDVQTYDGLADDVEREADAERLNRILEQE